MLRLPVIGMVGALIECAVAELNRVSSPRRKHPMTTTAQVTKDPICGMTVDAKTALSAERDGKTAYFCSEQCRNTFLSKPDGMKAKDKNGGCCG